MQNKKQIIDEVTADYERRKSARKSLEDKWKTNIDFYNGNQNSGFGKQYFWQIQENYNHIGPLVENRLAILADVRPEIDDELVWRIMEKIRFDRLVEEGNFWQETTGTVFYKVVSKNGEIAVSVCSPFEIYPNKLDVSNMDEIGSVIHAKNVDGKLVIEKWGKDDLIIINDGKLEYSGVLPFPFPFVRGTSELVAGQFFGKSVVERAIPVQRAYNAVKNRRAEFMNRMACGVVAVEDGSVDIDNLEIDGLCPGKIIVYRQGYREPKFMDTGIIPEELTKEEERLLNEFNTITGGGDIISELSSRAAIGQGSLSILSEHAKKQLRRPIQSIEDVYNEVSKKILTILGVKNG
jgi:hypothetical protein